MDVSVAWFSMTGLDLGFEILVGYLISPLRSCGFVFLSPSLFPFHKSFSFGWSYLLLDMCLYSPVTKTTDQGLPKNWRAKKKTVLARGSKRGKVTSFCFLLRPGNMGRLRVMASDDHDATKDDIYDQNPQQRCSLSCTNSCVQLLTVASIQRRLLFTRPLLQRLLFIPSPQPLLYALSPSSFTFFLIAWSHDFL